MSGKRIVIATIGSLGDLHPYLSLALGLLKRGHSPVVAAPGPYRARVEAAGLAFEPLRPSPPLVDRELYFLLLDPKKGPEFLFRDLLIPAIRDTYSDLHRVVTQHAADLLVSSPVVFAGSLVVEKLGTLWASTLLAPMAFFSAFDPPVLLGFSASLCRGPKFLRPWWGRCLRAAAKCMTRSWSRPVGDLRRELNLPRSNGDPLYEGLHAPALVLAMFSAALGAPQPDWPAQTRQTGFSFYDGDEGASTELYPALARFLDQGPAPIVFTLGSTAVNAAANFYAESITAAQMLGRRALLLVGSTPENRRSLPKPLPQGIAAFNYAPYSAVFRRAAAVVHHGGVGTIAQQLRAGIPSVVVPFNFDQPDNAARIARLGVGRVIPRARYTARSTAIALRTLLRDERASERARTIARQIARENGVDSACEALEQLLSNRASQRS